MMRIDCLAGEINEALAIGDRPRLIEAIKQLVTWLRSEDFRQAFKDITELIKLIRGLFGEPAPAAMDVAEDECLEAAAIDAVVADAGTVAPAAIPVATILELVKLLLAIWRSRPQPKPTA